ncbi:MAG: type II secretion system F family protein, partial [Thermoleophilum sp.]|nr:type II secretion system F family protein [Thermoleophilum sp.]
MATFAFRAVDRAGVATRGEMEADSKQAVTAQLRQRGLIVLDVEEKAPPSANDILARFKRVKADALVIATRQLATMVSSGMTLLRALYVIEEQTENEKLKETLTAVRKDVEAGLSFSRALAKHPDVFNDLYVAMVQAGESGGILEQTLQRVANQLEKDAALRRMIKAAMVYPSLVISFSFLVLIALVAFLVPVFAVFYGLDWIATVPPTIKLAGSTFGRERAPMVFGWIFAAHQIGAATAAFGAGLSRTLWLTYSPALYVAGSACLLAALLALMVRRKA